MELGKASVTVVFFSLFFLLTAKAATGKGKKSSLTLMY